MRTEQLKNVGACGPKPLLKMDRFGSGEAEQVGGPAGEAQLAMHAER